jgi:hypothetical protein
MSTPLVNRCSQLQRLSLEHNDVFFGVQCYLCHYLHGTMCAPPGGQNDTFRFLDQVNHITIGLLKYHLISYVSQSSGSNSTFQKVSVLSRFYPISLLLDQNHLITKRTLLYCLLFGVTENLNILKPHPH